MLDLTRNKKLMIIISVVTAVLACFMFMYLQSNANKKKIFESFKYFEDEFSANIEVKSDGLKYYISCDNFDELGNDTKLYILDYLNGKAERKNYDFQISDKLVCNESKYYLETYYENGESGGKILKDGEEIYRTVNNSTNEWECNTDTKKTNINSDKYTDNEYKVVAQKVVEENLKSASTAKFCKYSEMSILKDNKDVIITGYVDAENSFGAVVNVNFTVTYIEGDLNNPSVIFLE